MQKYRNYADIRQPHSKQGHPQANEMYAIEAGDLNVTARTLMAEEKEAHERCG
jgi:hypothetical protein